MLFFKVLPETERFQKIQSVREKALAINRHFNAIAEKYGATGYSAQRGYLAGSPNAYHFKSNPGPDWYSVGGKYSGFYYPKKKHPNRQELLVGESLLFDALYGCFGRFKPKAVVHDGGLAIISGPIKISWDSEQILFQIHPETEWEIPEDVVEIRGSEFHQISAEMSARKEQKQA